MTRAVLRGLIAVAAAAALGAGGWIALGSTAPQGPATAGSLAGRATQIADANVAWWERRQTAARRLPDPVLGDRGDYGTVMLMAAAARRAVADGDQRRLDAALGVLAVQANDPSLGAFELLAFSDLRAWAHARLRSEPSFAGPWHRWGPAIDGLLASRSAVSDNPRVRECFVESDCLTNQKLVGAAAVAALLEARLPTRSRSALLTDRAGRYRDLGTILQLVGERTAADVRSPAGPFDGGGILSDPPSNPVAYHALSTTMLGRVIEALRSAGLSVPLEVTSAYERAGRALLALQSPDGDLSYLGRGQGQVWVSAIAFAACARLAAEARTPSLRGPALAAARAALGRLEERYRGPNGELSLVPDAPAVPPVPSGRVVDGYASLRSYNGLAVWALDEGTRLLRTIGDEVVPSRVLPSGVTLAPEAAGLATIAQPQAWLAIAAARGRADDARYGPGLLTLRSLRGGRWASVVADRPLLGRRVPTVAIELSGDTLIPVGLPREASPQQVLVSGRWKGTRIDLPLRQRWTLESSGAAQLSWRAPATATVVVRAVVDGSAMAITGGVRDRAASWSLTVDGARTAPSRSTSRAFGSAYSASVRIVALRIRAQTGQVVRLRIAPSG